MSDDIQSPFFVQDSEFVTTGSANKFTSANDFTEHVYSVVAEVKEHRVFIFTEVPESWGRAAFKAVDEIIACRSVNRAV